MDKKLYRRGTATQEICDVLRREILTLELAPGQSLDETSLSTRFGVSRSPIREVLSRLQAERLVETQPNRASIVAPVDLTRFPQFIEALDLMQRYATRLAARNRSAADLLTLKKLARAYHDSLGGQRPFDILQANYRFHVAVAEAGGNAYVLRQYSELLSEARRLLHIHIAYLRADGHRGILADQHDDFVAAIEARDVERADAIAHAHTIEFHDRFLDSMQYAPDTGFRFDAGAGSAASRPVAE